MKDEDAAQFQEFARSRWAALVRTAYLLSGDFGEAEDLVQATLVRTYSGWRRVRASDHPDAYVRRILANENAMRFRKKRVTHLFGARAPEPTASDPATAWDDRDALMRALAKLPARQRAVVVLRYWEDVSEADVAQALGCSVGTVKSQAAKGLAKLRADPGLARSAEPADSGKGLRHE